LNAKRLELQGVQKLNNEIQLKLIQLLAAFQAMRRLHKNSQTIISLQIVFLLAARQGTAYVFAQYFL